MIVTSLLMISSLLTLARATPMSFTTYRRRELPVDEGAQLVLLYDQKGFENTDPSPRSVYDLERAYANEMALQQHRQHEMAEVDTSKMAEVNEALEEHGSRGGAARGAKKRAIGSLSIVNPVDVLRNRVLLELARRRMRQQEQQAAENRRILETIGKRSVHQLSSNPNDYTGNGIDGPSVSNAGVIYGNTERVNVRGNEKQRADQTQRIPIGMRSRDWYETGDNDIDDVDIVDNDDDDVAVTTRGNGDGNNTRKVAATYRQERI